MPTVKVRCTFEIGCWSDSTITVLSTVGYGKLDVTVETVAAVIRKLGEKGYRADRLPSEEHPEAILSRGVA